ncbi:MAG: PfkB family carbohydrate kinase [Pseudomonadota bacterium]
MDGELLEQNAGPAGPVVGLGQASLDFLGVAPRFPALDSKCELSTLVVQGGGPAATALVALSRLGVKTAFIGAVGDDAFGPRIRNELAGEGVDVGRLLVAPGGVSQTAFVAIDEQTGARTIFWHRGRGLERDLTAVDFAVISSARLLHLDGLKLDSSLAAARVARTAGVPTVLDAGTLRPGCLELAGLVDYLIVSEKFMADFNPGPDPAEGLVRLKALGPRHAVVTLGERGSLGYDGEVFNRQPAYRVKVLDTTGAGDAYHGGYIYGVLAGWGLAAAMRFAAALAALKCRGIGGRTALPDLETVTTFLNDPAVSFR